METASDPTPLLMTNKNGVFFYFESMSHPLGGEAEKSTAYNSREEVSKSFPFILSLWEGHLYSESA